MHRWAVGFAAGNFARTQTLAVFKKKSSTKKKKKRVQTISPHSDMKIQLIKDVKAGRRRRTSLTLDKSYEAQLRAAEG